jgi:hypothetical protein
VIIEVGGHNYTVDIKDKVAVLVVDLPVGNSLLMLTTLNQISIMLLAC